VLFHPRGGRHRRDLSSLQLWLWADCPTHAVVQLSGGCDERGVLEEEEEVEQRPEVSEEEEEEGEARGRTRGHANLAIGKGCGSC